MNRLALAVAASAMVPLTCAAECAAPPVQSSEQAICYAAAYADKNRLSHGRSFRKSVTKGAKIWTVHFRNTRSAAHHGDWEVDVDAATGTVIRFSSRK